MKHQLMASASVLLFPVAWGEGHPRIVLEAMAAGLPVITTDRSTIAETLDGGGIILPDPDPIQIAHKLETLLADKALREEMGSAGVARWRSEYTQDIADSRLSKWLGSISDATEP
jgi:glycosyltransferase involved in cell wall biosynthesis